MIHGKNYTYEHFACRCPDCKRAHRFATAERIGGTPEPESFNDPWLIINLPIAVIMRQAFSDEEAIATVS